MKNLKALLLLILSAGLLGTWVYHLYDKNQYTSKSNQPTLIKDTAIENHVKDSLQGVFNQAMQQMSSKQTDEDTLQGQLNTQVKQIFKLRNEIGIILKNRKITMADLDTAKRKIGELQQRIDEIKAQNASLEDERLQLNNTLDQLSNEMKSLQENVERLGKENQELAQTINEASTFIISEIKLAVIDVREGLKDVETSHANKASKFVFSFIVQNNIVKSSFAEIYVVIIDPTGHVLQDNLWESGKFFTSPDPSKDYTIKLPFEYHKGEQKKIIFTLEPEKFLKGIYKMEVYHNGAIIGEIVKKIS